MSSMQNVALHMGQGARAAIHPSGLCWSCLAANHLLMQDRHHMGLQKHCLHSLPYKQNRSCSLVVILNLTARILDNMTLNCIYAN